MKKFFGLLITLFLLFGSLCYADTITQTWEDNGTEGYTWVIVFVEADGAQVTRTACTSEVWSKIQGGYIYQVRTIPGATGPTNGAWEPVVNMGAGTENIIGTAADNRSSTAEQVVLVDNYFALTDLVYFTTTGNAQAGAVATVKIYVAKKH